MYDVPLTTRVTAAVDRRLRMLAVLQNQAISHLLVSLLDQHLPSADELAARLLDGGSASGDAHEISAGAPAEAAA